MNTHLRRTMLVVAVAIGISACIQKSFGDPVSTVGISGSFRDGDTTFSVTNPVAINVGVTPAETPISFYDKFGYYVVVDFSATEATGSAGVTISYVFDQTDQQHLAAGQMYYFFFTGPYQGKQSSLTFGGKLANDTTILIDSVVAYADTTWNLNTTVFPASVTNFSTITYSNGVPDGAIGVPVSASFTLDFDIPGGPSVPDSSATWMLLAGAVSCLLFWKRRQNQSA